MHDTGQLLDYPQKLYIIINTNEQLVSLFNVVSVSILV